MQLNWQTLEGSKIKNADNILAITQMGSYVLGRIYNGDFYTVTPTRGHLNKVYITRFVELPDIKEEQLDGYY
jgi:uncharacterized secreted protein with C-terminal beta-propeller domain